MSKRSGRRPIPESENRRCETCGRSVRKTGEGGLRHFDWHDDFYCFLVRTGGGFAGLAVPRETKEIAPQPWEFFDGLIFEAVESSEAGVRLTLVRPAQRWTMRVKGIRGLREVKPGDSVQVLVDADGVAVLAPAASENQRTRGGE